MHRLSTLLRYFRIKPKEMRPYELAFTHPSYNLDAKSCHEDYERLEFLGDSILGASVADLAFRAHPDADQGFLTKLRSSLVNTKALARYATYHHLADYIVVGNSFSGDISKAEKTLENVFEAFIGAAYIDLGFKSAYGIVKRIFERDILNYSLEKTIDYKSRLQEETQLEHRRSVTFRQVSVDGPAHKRTYEMEVVLDGTLVLGRGVGSSKKAAEQEAARNALEKRAGKK
ncbi:MAG: ribonuclease III [Bacilli bacterium]|jgi:ribonuclease-3